MGRKDRIEKLRRLAESPNVHEAARAREEIARLSAKAPDQPPATDPDFFLIGIFDGVARFRQELRLQTLLPGELPGVRRVPSTLTPGTVSDRIKTVAGNVSQVDDKASTPTAARFARNK